MPKVMRAPAARARQRGFFDFSVSELAIIFGLALVVLGPKKLPGLVQQIGRWVGRARHMARQFREQLEQEVNSINEVKPVPRHVSPAAPADVGPAAPEPNPYSDNHSDLGAAPAASESEPAPAAHTAAPAGNEVHPEAQMYFALNGSQPEVVGQDPYAPQPPVVEPQSPAPEQPEAVAKDEEPKPPATVEVIFPHDHG